ncbi:MAG: thermonuclease family protein [Gemmatimonadota bacterium]
MRSFLTAGLLWSLVSGCTARGAEARAGTRDTIPGTPAGRFCRIDRPVDGDTFYCVGGEKVRLIGMDSPELNQGALGQRSKAALSAMIPPGTEVRLERDVSRHDRYGRTLAYVWRDSVLINELMVREGWAVQYTVPPDVRHVDRFRAAERLARQEKAGLWREGGFVCTPSEHRKGHC